MWFSHPRLRLHRFNPTLCIRFLTFQQIEFAEGFVCGLIVSEDFLFESFMIKSELLNVPENSICFQTMCASIKEQTKGRWSFTAFPYQSLQVQEFFKWIDNKQQHFTRQWFVHNVEALITANKQTNDSQWSLLSTAGLCSVTSGKHWLAMRHETTPPTSWLSSLDH